MKIKKVPKNKDDIDLGTWTLQRATNKYRSDTARALIQRGADVDEMDPNSWTPLHWAAWKNSPDVAGLLIEHSADVNLKDKNGWTPLHGAVWNNSPDVGRLLIQHGAVNRRNRP